MILPDSCFLLLFREIWIIKTASAGTLLGPYPDSVEYSFPILCVLPSASSCFACHSLHFWAILRGLPLPLAYWSCITHRCESWHYIGVYTWEESMPVPDWQGQKCPAALLWGWSNAEAQFTLQGSHGDRAAAGMPPVTCVWPPHPPCLASILLYRYSPSALPPSVISKSSSSIQLLDGQP